MLNINRVALFLILLASLLHARRCAIILHFDPKQPNFDVYHEDRDLRPRRIECKDNQQRKLINLLVDCKPGEAILIRPRSSLYKDWPTIYCPVDTEFVLDFVVNDFSKQAPFDAQKILEVYYSGDLDQSVKILQDEMRYSHLQRDDSLVALSILGVAYASGYGGSRANQSAYYFKKLISIDPKHDLHGLYTTYEIERLYDSVRVDFLSRRREALISSPSYRNAQVDSIVRAGSSSSKVGTLIVLSACFVAAIIGIVALYQSSD